MNAQRRVDRITFYAVVAIVFMAAWCAMEGRLNTPTILVLLGMLGMCKLIRWLA